MHKKVGVTTDYGKNSSPQKTPLYSPRFAETTMVIFSFSVLYIYISIFSFPLLLQFVLYMCLPFSDIIQSKSKFYFAEFKKKKKAEIQALPKSEKKKSKLFFSLPFSC